MSQQQYPQYPPRAFSPQQRTSSPHSGPHPPPPPHPPNPQIPPSRTPTEYGKIGSQPAYSGSGAPQYGSPGLANIALPNQVFSSPFYGAQSNGSSQGHNYGSGSPYSPHSSQTPYNSQFNTTPFQPPPPVPSTPQHDTTSFRGGAMGPPSRPSDKPTDINDLGDVLAGSGVDLREEEAAMFNSTPTPYPISRDNHYSPYVSGDRQNFYGAGFYSQSSVPYKSPEVIAAEERKRATRTKAEIKQYHLNDPFLLTGTLRRKMVTHVNKNHIKFDDSGLFLPKKIPDPPQETSIAGPDGHAVTVLLQGQGILSLESTLVEILSLMSLATEERMRILVEDTATVAKGRRAGTLTIAQSEQIYSTNGRKDLDVRNALPTPADSAVSPSSIPLKRSYSEMNNLLPSASPSSAHPTNPVNQALQQTIKQDRLDEEKRLAKRAERKAKKAASEGGVAEGPGAPGTVTDIAPSVDVKKAPKKTKATDNVSQAQQLNALNNTTQMALGGKKMPSWMSGVSKGPSNPYLARSNATVKKENVSSANGLGSSSTKHRVFGDFREDGEEGKGIQLRDLLMVLEKHVKGLERKALQKAYARQGNPPNPK